jgi:transcriptional regulator with XRE-family HTH domain
MDGELGRGAAIKARRERLTWGRRALAERAGISRETLAKVEGDVEGTRPETYGKVERALDEIAEEIGDDDPNGAALEVTMRGVYGIDELVFRSPSQDPDVLAEAVSKILDQLKNRE